MSRNTCNALFSWKGDIMWNLDWMLDLPAPLKIIFLLAGIDYRGLFSVKWMNRAFAKTKKYVRMNAYYNSE